ncbi:MAG: FAD-dependent oxidoreductase, partial [Roseobacter sp.]|nr:FAD-dependent oxidoreductase [Roseobacter sp.]
MVDLTVRGAGIFGLSIAWTCVQRGARVRIIDPNGPGAGSSGGVVGALAPHVPENWNSKKAFQLDSLLGAEAFWADVENACGKSPGYIRSGRLQPIAGTSALALARARTTGAEDLWGDHAVWQVVPVDPQAVWAPFSPSGWMIRDTLSALLHPRQAINALVAALAEHDTPVLTEAPDCGQVLWATGVAGLDALSAQHPRSVGNGVKG